MIVLAKIVGICDFILPLLTILESLVGNVQYFYTFSGPAMSLAMLTCFDFNFDDFNGWTDAGSSLVSM